MILPKGYTLLECIESTGTQYIDTGFIPNNNTRVLLDAQYPTAPTDHVFLFGARASKGANTYALVWISSGYFRSDYNTTITQQFTLDGSGRYIFDKNKETTTIGGTTQSYTNAAFQSPCSLTLFGCNTAGTFDTSQSGSLRVYSCQIWDNGTLVRQYAPCINPDGEVGLYDVVEGKFYGNAGTGVFVAGDELLEVEYIESTGTQYIDTGFAPNQDTRAVADFNIYSYSAVGYVFGCRGGESESYNNRYGLLYNGAFRTDYGVGNGLTYSTNLVHGNRYIVDKNKAVSTLDSETLTNTAATFQSLYNMALFGAVEGGAIAYKMSVRLYSCQIYDNDVLVRHYIPMVTGGGVAGLYDLVNNTFSVDAAGGNFLAGPRIVELPEGYTQVEYIESVGKQYIDTLFYPTYQTRLVLDMDGLGTAKLFVYGARNASSAAASQMFNLYRTSATTIRTDYFASNASLTISDTSGRTTVDQNKNVTTLFGSTLTCTAATSGTSDYALYLFAVNNIGTALAHSSYKMYSCRIYDAGVLVRDYIPCTDSSGAGGLYDLVTDTFYANAGTGTFTVGDVVDAESQIPDGDETILITPTNFRTEYVTDSVVSLAWDAVDAATGYKLYRNLALISDQTKTEYTDTELVQFASYQYDVIAYNEEAQTDPATLVVNTALADFALALVTDRTQADVTRVKSLASKWMDGTITDEEKAEYLSFMMKGAYNFTDLNRVERAVEYINDTINGIQADINSALRENEVASDSFWVAPFVQLILEVKKNWGITDLPTESDLVRYLDNVSQTTDRIPIEKNLPVSVANNLKYDGANEIEKALLAEFNAGVSYRENMKQLASNTAKAFVQCGEIYGGEF